MSSADVGWLGLTALSAQLGHRAMSSAKKPLTWSRCW